MMVCAIITAFNNPAEFNNLLSSLITQRTELDGLLVLDNSDRNHVESNYEIYKKYKNNFKFFDYIEIGTNIGSAAAFSRGMEIAFKNDFKWIWLLDQDGMVTQNCLKSLLTYSTYGYVLCPNVYSLKEKNKILNFRWKINHFGAVFPVTIRNGITEIDFFGTHGTLLAWEILKTVGFYDSNNYFVGLEDFDYSYKILKNGFKIFLVSEAKVLHPEPYVWGKDHENKGWNKLINKINIPFLGYLLKLNSTGKREYEAAFSHFYLTTVRLNKWQFIVSFLYSIPLLIYFAMKNRSIHLHTTLKAYGLCISQKMNSNEYATFSVGFIKEKILMNKS